jgi:hypothetical protein
MPGKKINQSTLSKKTIPLFRSDRLLKRETDVTIEEKKVGCKTYEIV